MVATVIAMKLVTFSDPWDQPLDLELCAQMHFAAVAAAGQEDESHETPATLPLAKLREQARWIGWSAWLMPPNYIAYVFSGVTLGVYQTIDRIYCTKTRLDRSVRTVWKVLDKMVAAANQSKVSYEAVWTICKHLQARRDACLAIEIVRADAPWWIMLIPNAGLLTTPTGDIVPTSLICIAAGSRILSARIVTERESDSLPLCLYDALVGLREPGHNVPTGVAWICPHELVIDETLQVDRTVEALCQGMQITIQRGRPFPSWLETLRLDWSASHGSVIGSHAHLALLFDGYLASRCPESPQRNRVIRHQQYKQFKSYHYNPARILPPLRWLLPAQQVHTNSSGQIHLRGAWYADEEGILPFWPDQSMIARQHEGDRTQAWIYLDDELLCSVHRQSMQYRSQR